VWKDKILEVTSTINEAKVYHDKTVEYKKALMAGNVDKSKKLLLEMALHEARVSVGSSPDLHFILAYDESASMGATDGTTLTRWQKLVQAHSLFIKSRLQQRGPAANDIVSIIFHGSNARIIT
jgi:hypothetical protein